MGIQFLFILPQIIYYLLIFPTISSGSSDYTDFIYKGCADQKFQDPSGLYAQTLKSLFIYLITQSSNTNFSKTTAGEPNNDAIFGLFQCRGDLSNSDCNNCVRQFPKLARKLCGDAIAVRVQLVGCYMRYEIVGFKQVSSTELLYKYCKENKQVNFAGFEDSRESAFKEVESGVVSRNGFYAASYGSVYVMGQCEGDLVGSDCGDCVRTALERVKAECGNSISGQVYLHQCYISYSFYPNGVGQQKVFSSGARHNTAKTVAIVVGATAATGFGVVILLFLKSALKKKQPSKYHYGVYGG